MSGDDKVKALLFDLGGVVVEIDFRQVFSVWSSQCGEDAKTIQQRFTMEDSYERHERGEIGIDEYRQFLLRRLQIELSEAQFNHGWNAVFGDYIAGMEQLLCDAREKFPLFCLTNTNRTHHDTWNARFPAVAQWFSTIFASWQIGMRKPDAQVYLHVASEIGVLPQHILFFDDSTVNVEGARAVGMQAVLVTSIDDIRNALQSIG